MTKNIQAALAVAAVVLAAGCVGDDSTPTDSPTPSDASPSTSAPPPPLEKAVSMSVTDTSATAFYKYTPATLAGKLNEVVNITLTSPGGAGANQQDHDLVISELNVKSAVINPGGKTNIVFALSKTGSYKYYCSIGNHRQLGMEGTLTVSA